MSVIHKISKFYECDAQNTTQNTQLFICSPAQAGAIIRYTTDGSNPTGTSAQYTAPLNVAGLGAGTVTLKAAAYNGAGATTPLGVITTAVYSSW